MMTTFEEYLLYEETSNIIDLSFFIDTYQLRESALIDKEAELERLLQKMGFKVKHRKSLFGELSKLSNNIRDLLYYAFIAYYNNDNKARQKVKELSRVIKKENFLHVLERLDKLTLGILSYPLRIIDSLTGWKIKVNVDVNTKETLTKALVYLNHIADQIHSKDEHTKIMSAINILQGVLNTI